MRYIVFLFLLFLLYGCKSTIKKSEEIRLKFLDEFILAKDIVIDSTLVGGLSGIDYRNGIYYLVSDEKNNPRYYRSDIRINNNKIDIVRINSVIKLQGIDSLPDLESLAVDPVSNNVLIVGEGNINKGIDPFFIKVNSKGELLNNYEIPNYFKASSQQKPRHNGIFESLTLNFDNKGYWIATELPLKKDGPKPEFTETISPVRFTYFDNNGKAAKQFVYLLDKVAKKPLGKLGVNGVTDILMYAADKFLVIERSFSSGYDNQGNVVKIYKVDNSNASNTLSVSQLKKDTYKPAKKQLIFDFESIRNKLTNKSVDNIEGITFGPKLSNGNTSLILVSDNNFNTMGEQINQFILLEMILD